MLCWPLLQLSGKTTRLNPAFYFLPEPHLLTSNQIHRWVHVATINSCLQSQLDLYAFPHHVSSLFQAATFHLSQVHVTFHSFRSLMPLYLQQPTIQRKHREGTPRNCITASTNTKAPHPQLLVTVVCLLTPKETLPH